MESERLGLDLNLFIFASTARARHQNRYRLAQFLFAFTFRETSKPVRSRNSQFIRRTWKFQFDGVMKVNFIKNYLYFFQYGSFVSSGNLAYSCSNRHAFKLCIISVMTSETKPIAQKIEIRFIYYI